MLPNSFTNFAELREPAVLKTKYDVPFVVSSDPRSPATTIMAVIRAGVRYESQEDWGASHFLEHLLMRGTQQYPTLYELTRSLESLGGQTSAYSTRDLTAFWVKVPGGCEKCGFDVLSELLLQPALNPEHIEAERRIIDHERRRELANGATFASNTLESLLLAPNPMSRHPIGTDEGLNRMDRHYLRGCLDRWYHRGNMCLSAFGNLDTASLINLTDDFLSKVPNGAATMPANFLAESNAHKDGTVLYKASANKEQVFLALGWRFPILTHRELVTWRVINTLLGAGYTSLLNQELREKNSLTYLCTTAMNAYDGMGIFKLHMAMRAEDLAKALAMVDQIIASLSDGKIAADLFSEAAMRHAANLVYRSESALETVRLLGHSMARDGELFSWRRYLKDVEEVKPEEAAQLAAKYLSPQQRLTFVYSGAEGLKQVFPEMTTIE